VNTQRIIISRTDSIGDVVLTLPMAGVLKKLFPNCTIIFLGQAYTRPVINACEHIDEFIDLKQILSLPANEQIQYIRQLKADIIIHVFPRKSIARLARKARIPLRIGTTNRTYHWFTCNKLIRLSRKNSLYHEAQLNLKLIESLGAKAIYSLEEISDFYNLTKIKSLKDEFKNLLSDKKFNLILHPKSKGSAKEWGIDHFAKLIELLPQDKFNICITGTLTDGESIKYSLIKKFPHLIDLTGKLNLDELISFVFFADGMVAASTGPLHIAAALGKYIIGLYPSLRPIHAGRWAPLGIHAFYLEEDKSITERHGILDIRPEDVKEKLMDFAKQIEK